MPDVSLWTKVKFKALANTLVQLIPLINFYKMSPEDFYKKVRLVKKIVGKQLFEETLQYHLFSKNEQSNQEYYPSISTSPFAFKLKPLKLEPPEPLIDVKVIQN